MVIGTKVATFLGTGKELGGCLAGGGLAAWWCGRAILDILEFLENLDFLEAPENLEAPSRHKIRGCVRADTAPNLAEVLGFT